jgi:hypothetical protein
MTQVRIKSFQFREFEIVVGKDGQKFIANARDKEKKEIADASAETQEEVENEIKQKALHLSHDFVGFNEALKIFRKHFPQDFAMPKYLEGEREYKEKAVKLAQETLTETTLKQWIDSKNGEDAAKAIKKVMNSTNICSPFEKTRFAEYLANPKNALIFAGHILDVVYGKNFAEAFKAFSAYLNTTAIRSWPIATYYPYVLTPKEYIFLKPEIFQRCAYRLGYDDHYDCKISLPTYEAQLLMGRELLDKLMPYGAKDMIDVQSFMYTIASDGYAEELKEAREEATGE